MRRSPRVLVGALTVATLSGILWITLRPLPVDRPTRVLNLRPGVTLLAPDGHLDLTQLVGNLAMFSVLAWLLVRVGLTRRAVIVSSVGISIAIEALQFLLASGRMADVNDVLLNVAGAALGVALEAYAQQGIHRVAHKTGR